jgi:hypothetical protein
MVVIELSLILKEIKNKYLVNNRIVTKSKLIKISRLKLIKISRLKILTINKCI